MKKAGIFLILLAFLCVGQGFGPKIIKGPLPSVTASGAYSPTRETNIWFWYSFTDLETNSAITYWTSRLSAPITAYFTNESASTRPTNSQYGVGFDGTKSLTNNTVLNIPSGSGSFPSPSAGFYLVLKPFRPAANVSTVIGAKTAAYGLFTYNTGTRFEMWSTESVLAPFVSGELMDVGWLSTNNVGDVGNFGMFYTNGVFDRTSQCEELILLAMGRRSDAGSPGYEGYILDLIGFTNITEVNGPIIFSNLHYWRTNLYGGTP